MAIGLAFLFSVLSVSDFPYSFLMITLHNSLSTSASPETLWRHFSDIAQWPATVPSIIGSAKWESGEPWRSGSRFSMKLLKPMPVYFSPEVLEAAPPNTAHWIARGTSVTAEQWFSFDLQPDGTTRISARQNFDGPMTFMFGESIQKQITAMYDEWLNILKTQAEQG
jgi:hypothetical protein